MQSFLQAYPEGQALLANNSLVTPVLGLVGGAHALRFEPSDATVRLTNVKVNEMRLEVGGTALQGQLARLSALVTERLLDDLVIYRVSDEKREALRALGMQGAEVAITPRGVEVRFSDAR